MTFGFQLLIDGMTGRYFDICPLTCCKVAVQL